MHLYVYYRVAAADAAAMIERVHAMQARLVVETPIDAKLQRRADDGSAGDGTQTWMEVYPDAPPGFEERLAAAVAEFAIDPSEGPRHLERFEDVR